MTYTFGPVPSRRLGRSLGINNIPPKFCSYACVYCQLGAPQKVTADPREFYDTVAISTEVLKVLGESAAGQNTIDYVTVVPDGEPTLDSNLGRLLQQIGQESGIPRAVITNGSLLFHPDVAQAVGQAEWVSVKIDAAGEQTWRRIDRPVRSLNFETVLDGIRSFRKSYNGFFATETMLVDGLNTSAEEVSGLIRIISGLEPDVAYLSVPTRPPAESWVTPPDEATILEIYAAFTDAGIPTELNVTHEEGDFVADSDIENSILSITAVHPVRRDDMERLLASKGHSWSVIENLLASGSLLQKEYRGQTFFVRQLRRRKT
jgi:wyosine [tRNA(Phe)-imidazoG37] synthetase (radical SAM superfamily)